MPISSQSPSNQKKRSVQLVAAENPLATIINVTTKDTKESHSFQDNLKQLYIRAEKVTEIKYNFNETDFDADKKLSITSGGFLFLRDLDFTGKSIFFETDVDNVDVQILELY